MTETDVALGRSEAGPQARVAGTTRRIALGVVPGDGVGPEVMRQALRVLEAVCGAHACPVELIEFDWGCDRYRRTGRMAPDGWLEDVQALDAVLLGAVGHPDVPDHISLWELLIPLRQSLDLYVNLRPLTTFEGVPSSVGQDRAADIVIVRENTEGEYSKFGGRATIGDREAVLQTSVFTRLGIERVARFACRVAEGRTGRLVAATKSNGLIHSMPFWDEVVRQVAEEHEVDLQLQHVDALAARFVTASQDLDVVLASNLFGDILSDLGAAICGGLGLAPSANIDPDVQRGLFEPVHGSAPDIAGRGVANPIGQILSAAMLLDHFGETSAATDVRTAVRRVLSNPANHSRDLGGLATTEEVTDAVLHELMQMLDQM